LPRRGLKKSGISTACHQRLLNFRAAHMGEDEQNKTANVAKYGEVYDDDRFVRCQRCGNWINGRNPSSSFEHRGPLPHPRMAGAESIDDDD
jgi:hypothetical protein